METLGLLADLLGTVFMTLAAVGSFFFVFFYHRLTDWRDTPLGRNVMAFMTVAAILLGLGVFRAFFPQLDTVRDMLRAVGMGAVCYIVWRRVWLLLEAQSEQREIDRAGAYGIRVNGSANREEEPDETSGGERPARL